MVTTLAKPQPQAGSVRPFPRERYSDSELVAAVVRGDTEAMAVVWDRYGGAVRATLHASLGTDPVVEDLAQEVFLGFFRRAEQLRDRSALRPYLLGSAVRLAAFEVRTRSRRFRWLRVLASEPTRARTSLPDVEERDALRALRRILNCISERPRMAFILRYVQNLSSAEVAVALQVSEATAKRAIARGRERVVRLASRDSALCEYLARIEGGDR